MSLVFSLALAAQSAADDAGESAAGAYERWENGPPSDPSFFPLAVWLQQPKNAQRYREAGINIYVNRSLEVRDGRFEDAFEGYEVHLYRLAARE
jgi:hypothetical protein